MAANNKSAAPDESATLRAENAMLRTQLTDLQAKHEELHGNHQKQARELIDMRIDMSRLRNYKADLDAAGKSPSKG
jgi:hypothetical protein